MQTLPVAIVRNDLPQPVANKIKESKLIAVQLALVAKLLLPINLLVTANTKVANQTTPKKIITPENLTLPLEPNHRITKRENYCHE